MKWTKENIDDLILGYELQLDLEEISFILDRSIPSIKNKAHRLGITNKTLTNDEYIKRLKELNSSSIPLEPYINQRTNILHKCTICNTVYYANPQSKMQGYMHCNRKNNSGYLPYANKYYLYLVYLEDFNLYKYGITTQNVNIRIRNTGCKNFEIVMILGHEEREEVINKEKLWSSNLEKYKINTGKLRNGNTETFRY